MERYNEWFLNISEGIAKVFPDLLLALLVMVLGIGVAYWFKKAVLIIVGKLAATSNYQVARIAKSKYIYSFAEKISKLVFWAALTIAISMIFQILGIRVFEEWIKKITIFIPNLLGAFITLLTGFMLAKLTRDLLRESTSIAELEIKRSVPAIVYYSICAVSILISVEQLGIEIQFLTSSILVVLVCLLAGGTLSFGIGSAPIVTNLLSTFYLKKRIKVGQHITSSDISGTVVDIGTTCVFLKNTDGVHSIPSRLLNEQRITIQYGRD